jgi:hypothetical protein
MGRYYEQVKRYYDLFDHSRIKIYLYYDFRTRPAEMMAGVFNFLGVDDTFAPDISQRHNETKTMSSQQKPPLNPEVWTQLNQFFHDDNLKLQELIGRDLSHWMTPSRQKPVETDLK